MHVAFPLLGPPPKWNGECISDPHPTPEHQAARASKPFPLHETQGAGRPQHTDGSHLSMHAYQLPNQTVGPLTVPESTSKRRLSA